jgi:hypothetical protein
MTYHIESIDEENWPDIRRHSDILRGMTSRPSKRVVDSVTGDSLVELKSENHRSEWMSSCVFVSSGRSTRVTLSDPSVGKYQAAWIAWDGIMEAEITDLNSKIFKAAITLYPFTATHLDVRVAQNPYEQIPKATLVGLFDAKVGAWYGFKRYRLITKRTKELKEGVNSPFMWRFYWAKWKGFPTYTAIDKELIRDLSHVLWHPNHLQVLLSHLDAGGERFSDDSKRVLAYLRNRKRVADLLARIPKRVLSVLNRNTF